MRIVADSQGTVWDTLFTVKKEDDKTMLSTTMVAHTNNIFAKLINSMIRSIIAKAVEKDMDAVKVYCEK